MSATVFFAVALVVWLAIGATTAAVMARRGHEMFGWALLGAVFGPIVIVLALQAIRREGHAPEIVRSVPAGPGGTDVLVGLDGSPEAEAALADALTMIGDGIGRLALATVVDHGTWSRARDPATHEHLFRPLQHALDVVAADGVVLTGEPAAELARYARDGGFHLLVVGARGRGMAKILGSVARRLADGAGVPVLVGGREVPGRRLRTLGRAASGS